MLILLAFCLFFSNISAGFDTWVYPSYKHLNQDYIIYWQVQNDTINIALRVNTTGWIGFGLGEPTSGSMPGADFFVAQWVSNSLDPVHDRYGVEKAMPIADTCQDWTVLSVDKNANYVLIEISRKLNTGDSQDRAIVPGGTRILFAYSSENELSYHGSTRGVDIIEFIPQVIPDPPITNGVDWSFTMNNLAIPAQVTNYMCKSFPAPSLAPNQDYHVVKFDTIVDPRNHKYVHHMLLHTCVLDSKDPNSYVKKYMNASSCFSPGDDGGCDGIMYAWAVGGTPLTVPAEAGFRIGASNKAVKWFVLEIHYNNIEMRSDIIDSSGVQIVFTPNLRKFDAATLVVGNAGVDELPIPAGDSQYRVQSTCPNECTSQWSNDIFVFGDFMHMHGFGSMMWSTIDRNNQRLPGFLNRIEYWDFDFQDYIPMTKVIKRGDEINTICMYDTSSSTTPVEFGPSSYNEMCLEFIAYYPRLYIKDQPVGYCGSGRGRLHLNNDGTISNAAVPGKRDFLTVCGVGGLISLLWGSDNYTLPNPKVAEPWGDEVRAFGKPGKC